MDTFERLWQEKEASDVAQVSKYRYLLNQYPETVQKSNSALSVISANAQLVICCNPVWFPAYRVGKRPGITP